MRYIQKKHFKIKYVSCGIMITTFFLGTAAYAGPPSAEPVTTAGVETLLDKSLEIAAHTTGIQQASAYTMLTGTLEEDLVYSTNPMAGIANIMDGDWDALMAELEDEEPEDHWGYTNLGIANVSDHLNVRAIAAEDGRMVGKLSPNAACEVIEIDGGWAHIASGKVEGYVSTDYLLMGDDAVRKASEVIATVATVTGQGLKVREEPNLESKVITQIAYGEQVEVVAVKDGWVQFELDDEVVYVSADYVEIEEKLKTAITMTELLYGEGVSDIRIELCQYAKKFVGNPYVWGGTSLTKGADCSGFVLSVFKQYGITLPHSSSGQAGYGTKISPSEAKPGDLFFYAKGGKINHVAIYIGGGQVVHASSPKTGIKISNAYYRTPYTVRRILTD